MLSKKIMDLFGTCRKAATACHYWRRLSKKVTNARRVHDLMRGQSDTHLALERSPSGQSLEKMQHHCGLTGHIFATWFQVSSGSGFSMRKLV